MNVPPFRKREKSIFVGIDLLGWEGCKMLCKLIEQRWAEAGHSEIRAVPVEIQMGQRADVVYGVDIIGLMNGLPVQRRRL